MKKLLYYHLGSVVFFGIYLLMWAFYWYMALSFAFRDPQEKAKCLTCGEGVAFAFLAALFISIIYLIVTMVMATINLKSRTFYERLAALITAPIIVYIVYMFISHYLF